MEIINQNNNFQNSENGTAQDFKGANIAKLTNQYLLQQQTIILKYENNKLINSEELFLRLFKLNHLNITIKILHDYVLYTDDENNIHYLDEKEISLRLERKLLSILREHNNNNNNNNNNNILNEKDINSFISYVYDFANLVSDYSFNYDTWIKLEKQNKFLNLFNRFLFFKKIEFNKMPDINDSRLFIEFINIEKKFDFIDFFGYDFSTLKIHKNGLLSEYKASGYSIKDFYTHLDLVKNHNVILLSLFFDSHPYDGENWNYDKLKFWLKDQPSNLIIDDISSLEEIFEFAFNEYFTDEDEQKWSDLEDYYHNTRYEYQLKLERDKIENEIEDEFLDNCGFFSKNMSLI